uniref:Uncharacterized protein n=1 Tax=Steinernema glaseri TaxID=37863 RepID=A0A1I8AF81_9BILA
FREEDSPKPDIAPSSSGNKSTVVGFARQTAERHCAKSRQATGEIVAGSPIKRTRSHAVPLMVLLVPTSEASCGRQICRPQEVPYEPS